MWILLKDIKVIILDKNGQKRAYYKENSDHKLVLVNKTIPQPKWLNYEPNDPRYESLKTFDLKMFEFLKTKDFSKCLHHSEYNQDNDLSRADFFEIDCSQLLGIGGEAIVIKFNDKKKITQALDLSKDLFFSKSFLSKDLDAKAIKIIPIDHVLYHHRDTFKQESVTPIDNGADFTSLTLLKHPSLMDHSNVKLDFIEVFGEKKFVIVIIMPHYDTSAWDYLQYAATQPSDFFPIQSRMKMTKRILDGIIYMHQNGLCHRDIKLRRVFITLLNRLFFIFHIK